MPRAILILGATSAMARAAATDLAARGDRLFLASRDETECERMARDLEIRFGAKVCYGRFDARETHAHGELVQAALRSLDGLDGVIAAAGLLGNAPDSLDPGQAMDLIQVNYSGIVSVLGLCAQHMESQRGGVILGIGSVAGDRGRQSNFVYGSAKGGLALYLQGLRNRLHPRGVRVVTFKPGFVDTGMTYGKQGLFLVASPEQAGHALVRALDHADGVVYFPWFWRWIMAIIRSIPEVLFKRLKL